MLSQVSAAAEASGNPEGLPEGEGLPDVPLSLLPEELRTLPALAEAGSELRGLWNVNNDTFVIPGPWGESTCGGPYSATVYYPSKKHEWVDNTTHPVITLGHGYEQSGGKVAEQLVPGFIETMVAWGGYIVVAHLTAEGWCDTSQDMLYVLDWLKREDSPFLDKIRPYRTAAVGYNMGGLSALEIGHSEAHVQRHNITAVAALMPPCRAGCASPRVPAFFGAGSADNIVPYKHVQQAYEEVAGVDKLFAHVCGAPHWEVGVWGQNRHETHLLQFLGCYLWNTRSLCDKIFSECLSDRATER